MVSNAVGARLNACRCCSPNDRCRHCRALLCSLPSVPNHQCDRLADARSSPRRGRDQSHSRVILPVLPAKRSVRRARAAFPDKHRRRNARGASAARAWGISAVLSEPEIQIGLRSGHEGIEISLPLPSCRAAKLSSGATSENEWANRTARKI